MRIAIGSDHRGFAQKEYIRTYPIGMTIEWIDVGAYDTIRSDYPRFAIDVVRYIQQGQADLGIVLCGTGIGMAIAANRFYGIYAGVVWSEEVARLARQHDKVNVLSIPSDYVDNNMAIAIIYAWLSAAFLGERYQERIDMIDALGGIRK